MKNITKLRKKEDGITLIALIITIIILLILAGITIATLTGENRHTIKSRKGKKTNQYSRNKRKSTNRSNGKLWNRRENKFRRIK